MKKTTSAAQKEETAYKVRENRLRRVLSRQGYRLMKGRSATHGGYMICDLNNCIVAGGHGNAFSMSLDDVEKFANEKD